MCEYSIIQSLQAVEKLVDIAVRPAFETEVRITSYLAAIRCAEQEHLETIIEKISKEENTQGMHIFKP